jgi:hypothetical protein
MAIMKEMIVSTVVEMRRTWPIVYGCRRHHDHGQQHDEPSMSDDFQRQNRIS